MLRHAWLGSCGYYRFVANLMTAIEGFIIEKKCEFAISTSNLFLIHKNYFVNYAKTILNSYDVYSTALIGYSSLRSKKNNLKMAAMLIFCLARIATVIYPLRTK
jgi:hypothetical protein